MILNSKKERLQFFRNWTIFNALALILSFILSFFVVILLAEFIFGFSVDAWGTPLEQIVIHTAAGIVVGLGIGITQYKILRKVFNVSPFWLYAIPIGFIFVELIIGIIFWEVNINRGELSFIEGNPLPHAFILAVTGLLIGLIQIPLLSKHFCRVASWIVASTLAWGVSVLITILGQQSEIGLIATFLLGTLFYGSITGATLVWIFKPKKIDY
jgi:hypothetical protein